MKKESFKFRTRIACLLLVASVLLSAGCYVTEINADGSGVLTREIVIPPGTDPQKFCPGAPRGYSTRIEGPLCKATATFNNLSELRELIEAMKSPTVRINQLEKTGGKFIVDLSVDTPEWSAGYVDHHYYWKLKMPGHITSHNANRPVEGNVLTWVVQSGHGVFRVQAESQVP
jgi:hypothetical protein